MNPAAFPIQRVLPQLKSALNQGGIAILAAPPGSGKTTRVPLALLEDFPGTVLVLEPRRLAARSAARFMARHLGEAVGQRIGYRVRLENKVSPATRVEFLTEGILTRRLLADPELTGVSCVIFDEFHERSVPGDVGLALCLEARQALRPDLRLLVMSATLDVAPLRRFLGECPVIEAQGRVWPVTIRYEKVPPRLAQGAGWGNDLTRRVTAAITTALREEAGDILVFLPGTGEIRHCARALEQLRLSDSGEPVSVHPLFGDLPSAAQDAAIMPSPEGQRKIVLATSIAETSLTIEGIRIVIDSGLARSARFDPATGMNRLSTTRITQAGAEQRAGRAGRLEPGVCYRLWPEGESLLPHPRPQIEDVDLAPLLLDLLAWGANPADVRWLTPPPLAALHLAAQLLLTLDAARVQPGQGSPIQSIASTPPLPRLGITPHGHALARIPAHPRLAHMLLLAEAENYPLAALAACLAALVTERDPLRHQNDDCRRSRPNAPETDIRARLGYFATPAGGRLKAVARQLYDLLAPGRPFRLPGPELEDHAGRLLSLAWPEYIAHNVGNGLFRLANGQQATIPTHDPLARCPWLAAAVVRAPQGGQTSRTAQARIFLAAPLTLEDIHELHGKRLRQEDVLSWDKRERSLVSVRQTRLDELVLEERPLNLSQGLREAGKTVIQEAIGDMGLHVLPWSDELRQWQARVCLLRRLDAEQELLEQWPWPRVDDEALLAGLSSPQPTAPLPHSSDIPHGWLAPWLESVSRASQFGSIDMASALHSLLSWPLSQRLEHEAPTRLVLPSGTAAAIDYTPSAGPVLAVKLQEMFGQTETPAIASGRCPLTIHLLSPAGRPLQVTRDLPHFWANTYKQVRAEMRGRYPKHPWPDDPLTAIPTGKTKKRFLA